MLLRYNSANSIFTTKASAAPVATASSSRILSAALFAASVSTATVYSNSTRIAQCDAAAPPVYGIPGTNQERTFIAVKPDGVQRGLIGDIIARFEKRGYKLVGLKMVWPTLKMAEDHYADLSKKPFYAGLTRFFSSGPIVCMCWEGKDVIKQGRQMLGEVSGLWLLMLLWKMARSKIPTTRQQKCWYFILTESILICLFGANWLSRFTNADPTIGFETRQHPRWLFHRSRKKHLPRKRQSRGSGTRTQNVVPWGS